MSQIIKIKRSTVSGKIPSSSSLQPGELALNITDEKLYSTKIDGTIFELNPVDSILSNTSTNSVQNKVITTKLESKVDKVDGKGLSTNDYVDSDKEKVDRIIITGGATKSFMDDGQYHILTKLLVGLGNVDNTSDLLKPISNSTNEALLLKANKDEVYTKEEIDSKLAKLFNFKGAKDNFSEVIELTDAVTGDVWLVKNDFSIGEIQYTGGTNVLCIIDTSTTSHTESNWIALVSSFDMSSYVRDDEILDNAVCISISDVREIL